MRVLVVEDSDRLRKHLSHALKKSGYAVDAAADGEDGLAMAQEIPYDAIILDIMLPKLSGLDVLQKLRDGGRETPILLLTAKDTVPDRVLGLQTGADDYMIKPFALEELLARVQSLCRRRYQRHSTRLQLADLELDTAARSVFRGTRKIDLTAREFALLELLMHRQGDVVSRMEIEEHIYDDLASPMSNVVDATVYAVRRKLKGTSDEDPLITTRRGMGYVIGAPG